MKICAWCGKDFDAHYRNIYCSDDCKRLSHNRKCLERNREKAGKELINKRNCIVCGKEFVVGRGGAITCSEECRTRHKKKREHNYYVDNHTDIMRKCVVCGKEFRAMGSHTTCSDKCRESRNKKYRKEYWESYREVAKQKKKEYEAKRMEEQPKLDGKVLHRAEMTVDEYNRTHGTNYSYGQYVYYVESKGVK